MMAILQRCHEDACRITAPPRENQTCFAACQSHRTASDKQMLLCSGGKDLCIGSGGCGEFYPCFWVDMGSSVVISRTMKPQQGALSSAAPVSYSTGDRGRELHQDMRLKAGYASSSHRVLGKT